MKNAMWHLLTSYNNLADAIRNGTIAIERVLQLHCGHCDSDVRREIQKQVDRIKEAFDGRISAPDAVTDDPAESSDDSEAEGV